jgi:hypothetical protein
MKQLFTLNIFLVFVCVCQFVLLKDSKEVSDWRGKQIELLIHQNANLKFGYPENEP